MSIQASFLSHKPVLVFLHAKSNIYGMHFIIACWHQAAHKIKINLVCVCVCVLHFLLRLYLLPSLLSGSGFPEVTLSSWVVLFASALVLSRTFTSLLFTFVFVLPVGSFWGLFYIVWFLLEMFSWLCPKANEPHRRALPVLLGLVWLQVSHSVPLRTDVHGVIGGSLWF